MSDEEKKAVESLKNIAIYIGDNYTFSQQGIRNLRENLRIVLPVIEKQSKEIEELKDTRSIFNMGRRSYKNEIENKIKAKIEEIDMTGEIGYLVKGILQSLLEKE